MKALLADDPRFVSDSFWSDGMVRVSGREYNGLIESPCFKDATGGHTDACRAFRATRCTSRRRSASDGEWADTHQVHRGMDGNDACLQCHVPFRDER